MQNDLSNYQLIEGSGRKKLADFVILCEFCDENWWSSQLTAVSWRKNSAVPVTSVMEDSGQENVFECIERNNMQSNSFSYYKVLLQKMQIKF